MVNQSAYPERTPVTSSGGGLQNSSSSVLREEHETSEFLVSSEEFYLLVQHRGTEDCSRPDFHGTKRNIYIHLVNQYFVRSITHGTFPDEK